MPLMILNRRCNFLCHFGAAAKSALNREMYLAKLSLDTDVGFDTELPRSLGSGSQSSLAIAQTSSAYFASTFSTAIRRSKSASAKAERIDGRVLSQVFPVDRLR